VIVRILGEGQYDLEGQALGELKRADQALFRAVADSDEGAFHQALQSVLALVRTRGTPLPVDRLTESDLILPPPDTTLAEAQRLFTQHPFVGPVE